jgi:hypothetical protein
MKISELMDALTQYDPSEDVVIVGEHTQAYFDFIIKKQTGAAVTKGQDSVVALAVIGEFSQYFVTLEE